MKLVHEMHGKLKKRLETGDWRPRPNRQRLTHKSQQHVVFFRTFAVQISLK